MTGFGDSGDQAGSRVADGRRARVSGQGDIAFIERLQQAGQLPFPVVLVAAEQPRVRVEMGQQAAGDPGVLGSHEGHGGQDAAGPEGEVPQVPDGSADYVEDAHEGQYSGNSGQSRGQPMKSSQSGCAH